MNFILLAALALGTIVMLLIMLICRKWIAIGKLKIPLFAVLLTACGFASVKIMFFIENREWSGLSFFGAIFFVPLFLFLVAFIIREPLKKLMDLSAPSICGMLAIMKLECIRSGCCGGRLLYSYYKDGAINGVYFPSQIVEFVNALAVMVILMLFMRKSKYQGKIYPLFMIIYGGTRFLWNLFRQTEPFIWIMPAGNFWSLISIMLGCAWLIVLNHIGERNEDYI